MRAMVLEAPKMPMKLMDVPIPQPEKNQVLIKVHSCGICRTDLHIIDGELPHPKLPLILGHQIVGIIEKLGEAVNNFKRGDRVGVPWLGGSCGKCEYCQKGQENLCDHAVYTGYQLNGGFAEYCVANSNFIFPIPSSYSDLEAAPLLCGGLIGYRAYRMTAKAKTIGFYGFGSSAHLLTQLAVFQGREVYAFTRPGDTKGQEFAKSIGAVWAGNSNEEPPVQLDAAIIFAPSGELVPQALKVVCKGGVVVCAGIYMSDIPSFPYSLIYGEKILRSVTNLTRQDGEEFLQLATQSRIKTTVTSYELEQVNEALEELRKGEFFGSGVIVIDELK
ncbi:MAG: zinc-dependent alcohol dehydrogenase family protein [Parachlamydiaceae bacterium]|nr:zinc-dependent alcohol dehydrogenase family protein [Parachlamydiaceae bacterium]